MLTNRVFTPRRLVSALALVSASMAPQSFAQGLLEEVVVTAAKRQQTLQEVPIAVSVVTAESIEQSQVLDIKDLQTLVPSLRVTQLQGSAQTNFIIRGFGNGANNAGIEPSVGVFIDGVYRSRVGSALADLPKVERIEVLRGPQSTLFGKNASAGVINVVTAKPDLTGYSGSVGATLGNYNQTLVRGDVTGPLSDNVAFSAYASVNERDGYFDNLELGTEYNDLDRWSARGQLLWNPSDRAEVRFIVDGESIDETCCGVASLVDGPTGAIVRAIGGDLVGDDPFAYENFYDFDPINEIDTRGVSMQIDYDFDNFTLTSITSVRSLEQVQSGDVDYTSARLVAAPGNFTEGEIDNWTQEIRLTSATDGPLQWMVGAFYYTEETEITGNFPLGADFRNYVDFLLGGPATLAFVEGALGLPPGSIYAEGTGSLDELYTLDDDTLSLFTQFDYAFNDALTLTVGLNYTESNKEASLSQVNNNIFGQLPLDVLGLGALSAAQFLPSIVALPNSVEDNETKDDDITYTVRLAYDLTSNMNVYAGVSTGFKATSWNLSRDSGPVAADLAALIAAGDPALPNVGFGPGIANYPGSSGPATRFAGPEESTVYEIGLKGEWDNVSLNLALFNQEIDGFQQNLFLGTGFQLLNAGTQSTDGLEVDLTWVPIQALRIGVAATFLDPVYDDFEISFDENGDPLTGQQPAGIPELSTNINVTYNFNVGEAFGYVRVEHVFEDEVKVVDGISADLASREVNMFNASAGLTFSNGVELNLWGRNLNNDEYLLSAFPSVAQAGSFSSYPNQPRTYGLTLKYNFE
ncbi:MAG: TonB-dependent receptor [Pseudomonadota bacterium]